jgi:4-aminobutyrate aminotransferase-like enzyme
MTIQYRANQTQLNTREHRNANMSTSPAPSSTAPETAFAPVALSLAELLGVEFMQSVCANAAFFSGADPEALWRKASERVDFLPEAFQEQQRALLEHVGRHVGRPLSGSARGASSDAFNEATKKDQAPVGGMGSFRMGEGGRLHLIAKSEHYHAPLGHAFPGDQLVDRARELGLNNATHNNTRGHATRLLEEHLVRRANGIAPGDHERLERVLDARGGRVLNRVLNLETGSLAAEAALKCILSRFYAPQPGEEAPEYAGRTPVFIILGDHEGGLEANYHGTTILTQVMRGMWPEMACRIHGGFQVRAVRPNRIDEFEQVLKECDSGETKVAGFFHEFVMMNYAGLRLKEDYIRRVYDLCQEHDVKVVADEIQTCVWSPELFMFREYGVQPDAVVVGKGFPNGLFAASRVIFSPELDRLPLFGALITNGQEELASLAYLITMTWQEANAEAIQAVGEWFEARLRNFAEAHPDKIVEIEGRRHLAGVYFRDLEQSKAFAKSMNQSGLDVSVQTYKKGCPPCALMKLPLIMGCEGVDFVVDQMERAIRKV